MIYFFKKEKGMAIEMEITQLQNDFKDQMEKILELRGFL